MATNKHCYGCCKNDAVMDLVFGEMVAVCSIPWCAHCICPDAWNGDPFHHAEAYNTECKTDTCFVTGCTEKPVVVSYYESKNGKWKDSRPYCQKHYKGDQPHTVYAPNSQMHYRNSEWLEPDKEPQCTKCGEPANIAAFDHMYCAPCYNAKIEEKPSALDEMAEAAQKVINGISGIIKENFIPKMPVPLDRPTDPGYAPLVDVEPEDTKSLYNRQPHYEGGIDPITYGQDNFTSQEMNGFYKMNVVKYVSRCDRKNGLEDLKKAQDYLNLLIKSYEEHSVLKQVEKDAARKARVAKYKEAAGCAPVNDDEREKVIKEAELCVLHLRQGRDVQIKRADVAKEVLQRIQGQSYYMSYDDGVTRIKLKEES